MRHAQIRPRACGKRHPTQLVQQLMHCAARGEIRDVGLRRNIVEVYGRAEACDLQVERVYHLSEVRLAGVPVDQGGEGNGIAADAAREKACERDTRERGSGPPSAHSTT